MDYFRVSQLNGLTGPMYGVEFTQNDGESWTTMSVHNTPEAADREMRSYIALRGDTCALWEGSLTQKISDAEKEKAKRPAANRAKYMALAKDLSYAELCHIEAALEAFKPDYPVREDMVKELKENVTTARAWVHHVGKTDRGE
jgi:hypothetical protein